MTEKTFWRFGKLGKPFNDVSPTLMRLSDRRFLNSSVRPETWVALQLSKISSVTWQNIANSHLQPDFNNAYIYLNLYNLMWTYNICKNWNIEHFHLVYQWQLYIIFRNYHKVYNLCRLLLVAVAEWSVHQLLSFFFTDSNTGGTT